MLLLTCPFCGPRPEIEFAYGGEAHVARPADPATLSDGAWAEFLYMRTNPRGPHAERWRHTHGCARFFNAVRDTLSDKVLAVYKIGEQRPDMARLAVREPRLVQGAEDVGRDVAGQEIPLTEDRL